MDAALRWTSADLEVMPDNGKRYEIIDGELYVSKPTQYLHQRTVVNILSALIGWSDKTRLGIAIHGLRVMFADDDDVIPDVAWVNAERLHRILGSDGYFHAAPDLIAEVLQPGTHHEQRDCEAKLDLYARRGVLEYWIVDWVKQRVIIFRRKDARLKKTVTLQSADVLASPLLPGFQIPVRNVFKSLAKFDL